MGGIEIRRVFLLPRTRPGPSAIATIIRSAGGCVEAGGAPSAIQALAGAFPTCLLFPSSGCVATVGAYLRTLRGVEPRPFVVAFGDRSSRAVSDTALRQTRCHRSRGLRSCWIDQWHSGTRPRDTNLLGAPPKKALGTIASAGRQFVLRSGSEIRSDASKHRV